MQTEIKRKQDFLRYCNFCQSNEALFRTHSPTSGGPGRERFLFRLKDLSEAVFRESWKAGPAFFLLMDMTLVPQAEEWQDPSCLHWLDIFYILLVRSNTRGMYWSMCPNSNLFVTFSRQSGLFAHCSDISCRISQDSPSVTGESRASLWVFPVACLQLHSGRGFRQTQLPGAGRMFRQASRDTAAAFLEKTN